MTIQYSSKMEFSSNSFKLSSSCTDGGLYKQPKYILFQASRVISTAQIDWRFYGEFANLETFADIKTTNSFLPFPGIDMTSWY